MANELKRVQFAKGLESIYKPEGVYNGAEFDGTVFFATDSAKIYVDGVAYGIGGTVLETLKSNNFVSSVQITETDGIQSLEVVYYDNQAVQQTATTPLFLYKGKEAIDIKRGSKTVKGENDEEVSVATNEFEVLLKIDAQDKVLTQSEGGLLANVSLSYENNKIELLGKDGTSLGSADLADFTKDRFVESGEVVTITEDMLTSDETALEGFAKGDTALKLVLKTGTDDETTTVYIKANDLVNIDTYTQGEGILFEEDITGATGTGKKIKINLASSNSYLTTTNGLAVDVDSVGNAIKDSIASEIIDDIKDEITTDDIKVPSQSEEGSESSLTDVLSGLQTDVETVKGLSDTVDDLSEQLSELDGTKIQVGGEEAIHTGVIDPTTTIQEALKNLDSRINELTGTDAGTGWTDTLLNNYAPEGGSIVTMNDALKALDSAVKDLRVNGVQSNWDESGKYQNIEITGDDIAIPNDDFTGVLSQNGVESICDALQLIDNTITWHYYDTVSESVEPNS